VLEAERAPWGEAVLRVRYEDLTGDPETWTRRLCAHVGVEWVPDVLDVSAANTSFVDPDGAADAPGAASAEAADAAGAPADASRRGIFASSQERWRTELTPTEIWLGERVFGPVMEEFGYAPARGDAAIRPSPLELARIGLVLPGRLYNMLFRSHKPFKLSKVRRVVGLFRAR